MRLSFLVLVITMLLSNISVAASKGTTAATFLKIGVGSRAVSMGESYVAVADEPSASYWNPSGLAQLTVPAITAMHVFWIQDIYLEYIAGVLPLKQGTLGASIIYLNHGELIRSDENDDPDDPLRGVFTASNTAFTVAYAMQFSSKMFLGANLKLISESIDAEDSLGVAIDLGLLYELPWEKIRLGFLIQNVGPGTQFDAEQFSLPINFKLGLAYRPLDTILVSADYNQLWEQYGKVALGVEYAYDKILFLRAGYQYQGAIDENELYTNFGTNAMSSITAGLGIAYSNFNLDYAYAPYGFLGSTHRITLSYAFNQPKTKKSLPTPTPQMTATPQATPTPAPTPVPPKEVKQLQEKIEQIKEEMNKGVLKTIRFKSGSSELWSISKKTLDVIAKEIKKFPDIKIKIEGHTDATGNKEDNLVLSQLRVENVKNYLVQEHGIDPKKLTAVGYGETQPIADNQTEAGREKNRRVEFTVISDQE